MKYIGSAFRLVRINFILVRYNLDEILFSAPVFYPFRFLMYFNPWYWALRNKYTRGERIRMALEALGPIFIKAGQVVSTRRDLIPDDVAEELAKLQDRVPPFSGKVAKRIVETALKQPVNEVFSEFDADALASASIAQVHAAKLLDGKSVVVKVLRPEIKKSIDRDVDLLYTLANLANKYWPEGRRFKPREIVSEVAHTLYDELDLLREGANASQLRRNFHGCDYFYVPEIDWFHSRGNILVMERIEGIPVHNIAAIKAAGINIKRLAERGVEIFFTQVFRDSFFHADMHPGNIFVSTKDLENPQIIAVDFGIVGSLSRNDQRYLAENMLAFFKRDYQRVAELHIASGWLPPDTRVDQFEGAIRAVCEPIFERPLRDISFGQLLLRLFQAARAFNINIQPQLILLQKTLLNVEGVGRQLYPDLDLWKSASPYLDQWLRKQVGPKAFLCRIRDNLPLWSEQLPELPSLVYEVVKEQRNQLERQRYERMAPKKSHKKPQRLAYLILGLVLGFVASVAFVTKGTEITMPVLIVSIAALGFCVLAELF